MSKGNELKKAIEVFGELVDEKRRALAEVEMEAATVGLKSIPVTEELRLLKVSLTSQIEGLEASLHDAITEANRVSE